MPTADTDKEKRKEVLELLKLKEQWIAAVPKEEEEAKDEPLLEQKEESKGELVDIVREEQHNIEDELRDAPTKQEDDSPNPYKDSNDYADVSLYESQHTGGTGNQESYHRHTTSQESYREANKKKGSIHISYDG